MFNVTLLCWARVGSWTTLKEMVWAILYTDRQRHTASLMASSLWLT